VRFDSELILKRPSARPNEAGQVKNVGERPNEASQFSEINLGGLTKPVRLKTIRERPNEAGQFSVINFELV
jgi:hypothetical protein